MVRRSRVLIVLTLLSALGWMALLLWWWQRHSGERAMLSSPSLKPAVPRPSARPAGAMKDDLERIRGIGPKVAVALKSAGVTTFARLASTDVDRLKQILRDARVRGMGANTWPEQARLVFKRHDLCSPVGCFRPTDYKDRHAERRGSGPF
jgi:predicted flap endonuclease-1-like 5' DNA nuclease